MGTFSLVGKGRHRPISVPQPVTNLVATALGTSIELTWDDDPAASTYRIYRNTVNDYTTATFHDQAENSWVHTNLTQSTVYYYWISKRISGNTGVKAFTSKSTGAFRTDIITPGLIGSPTVFYNANAENLMTTYSLNPGDVIVLQPGYYNTIDFMGYFNDITITSSNTGTVNISGRVNFGAEGQHHKFIGNLAVSKNITISSGLGGYFATSSRSSGDIYYRNLSLVDNFMGIQVEHRDSSDPEYASYLLDYQNLIIDNVTIDGTGQEAMYIGSNIISDHQIYGIIRNCTVLNNGRDGIQCRNGLFRIEYNTITGVGQNLETAHGHGILYGGGGGSTDINLKTWILNNEISDAYVYGIFINGYGYIWIEGNNVQSDIESAIFCKNYESDTEDILGIAFQHFTLKNNTWESNDPTDPHAVDIRRDNTKCIVTVHYYSTNTLVAGNKYIEDGVNGAANGITTVNL